MRPEPLWGFCWEGETMHRQQWGAGQRGELWPALGPGGSPLSGSWPWGDLGQGILARCVWLR